MKTMVCLAFLMFFSNVEKPNLIEKKGNLVVHFSNVNVENKGKIYVAVFDKEENFMTQNFFKSVIVEVESDAFEVTFKDVPYGDYAVSAFHDINGNGQMDFNEYGMPVEDYAMSGETNPMGAPTWSQVKFEFTEQSTTLEVKF